MSTSNFIEIDNSFLRVHISCANRAGGVALYTKNHSTPIIIDISKKLSDCPTEHLHDMYDQHASPFTSGKNFDPHT